MNLLLTIFLLFTPIHAQAQEASTEQFKAEVIQIVEAGDGYQVLEATSSNGETFTIDTREGYTQDARYSAGVGDKIVVQKITYEDGSAQYFFVDVTRGGALLWLALLFALVTLAVGRWRGVLSIIGLAVTFSVLLFFILPQILSGSSPVLITVIGALIILAVNLFLAHGWKPPTQMAFLGTGLGLAVVVILAEVFVRAASLTGLSTEEAALLQIEQLGIVWPAGILLAGIVLGAVGVIDDVAVTQAETVAELKSANPNFTKKELFVRAMRIGRHHIASVVNTLVLAYIGASLPLFLLFVTADIGVFDLINQEFMAEEIVRTLAGTIGLILTVPFATWLASWRAAR